MKFFGAKACEDRAKAIFKKWKSIIEAEIPSSKVEHVGSTAVHGALTKGDIDLYVEIPKDAHATAVSAIETMGFRVKLDTHRDSELCMLEHPGVEGFALQVVARGSRYNFFLRFRDALNSDEYLVQQYNDLKLSCIGATPEQYRERKTRFILDVLHSTYINSVDEPPQ